MRTTTINVSNDFLSPLLSTPKMPRRNTPNHTSIIVFTLVSIPFTTYLKPGKRSKIFTTHRSAQNGRVYKIAICQINICQTPQETQEDLDCFLEHQLKFSNIFR